ncbi:hypothetical protein BHE74_00040102 [Ensete ventricosum]|uniref:Calponin-homology (CH) domain-containing protein n=1 Tax=Ensete ventricosum TaxID=4639 RepID=A0A426ZFY4_ENSVE|nr:hypothetical protein B296_00038664 [Ensete ventricosum]RWW53413.1 hypothetical protein BHE74_00040102 [Ensete ventricosum]
MVATADSNSNRFPLFFPSNNLAILGFLFFSPPQIFPNPLPSRFTSLPYPCLSLSSGRRSRRMEEGGPRRVEPCTVSFRDGPGWLESILGPLGLSPQPAEKEFTSCLRSDIVLCNEINKIQPGAVPKVLPLLGLVSS